MKRYAYDLGISGIEFEGCYYITFKSERTREELLQSFAAILSRGIDRTDLVSPGEQPLFDKFDAFIPGELLRRAYAIFTLKSGRQKRLACGRLTMRRYRWLLRLIEIEKHPEIKVI